MKNGIKGVYLGANFETHAYEESSKNSLKYIYEEYMDLKVFLYQNKFTFQFNFSMTHLACPKSEQLNKTQRKLTHYG